MIYDDPLNPFLNDRDKNTGRQPRYSSLEEAVAKLNEVLRRYDFYI